MAKKVKQRELATPSTPHRLVAGKWVPINTDTKPTTKAERRKIYEKARHRVLKERGEVLRDIGRIEALESRVNALERKLDECVIGLSNRITNDCPTKDYAEEVCKRVYDLENTVYGINPHGNPDKRYPSAGEKAGAPRAVSDYTETLEMIQKALDKLHLSR